ncbi:MAG: hypothetical protein Q8N81_07680 [bacterium]|nr:hypothetical protein [bacterium]
MKRNLLKEIRRVGLMSLAEAEEIKGAGFLDWLADQLGVNVEIVNFGWGDYGCSYLKLKSLVIGGP